MKNAYHIRNECGIVRVVKLVYGAEFELDGSCLRYKDGAGDALGGIYKCFSDAQRAALGVVNNKISTLKKEIERKKGESPSQNEGIEENERRIREINWRLGYIRKNIVNFNYIQKQSVEATNARYYEAVPVNKKGFKWISLSKVCTRGDI